MRRNRRLWAHEKFFYIRSHVGVAPGGHATIVGPVGLGSPAVHGRHIAGHSEVPWP